MAQEKKTKQPDWKKWGEEIFMPWYDRNKPEGLTPPKNNWKKWGEETYTPWYKNQVVVSSNPSDPPPPPPGPIKP